MSRGFEENRRRAKSAAAVLHAAQAHEQDDGLPRALANSARIAAASDAPGMAGPPHADMLDAARGVAPVPMAPVPGSAPLPGAAPAPAPAPVPAPVFVPDDRDAAAEKKGFWGGLGRRINSPRAYLGKKFDKYFGRPKTGGVIRGMSARPLRAEDEARFSRGDAERYEQQPARTSAADSIAASPWFGRISTANNIAQGAGKLLDSNMPWGGGDVLKYGGYIGAGASALSGIQGISKAVTSGITGGNTAAGFQAGLDAVENLSGGFSGAAGALKDVISIPSQVVPGLGIAGGGAKTLSGLLGAVSGGLTERSMRKKSDELIRGSYDVKDKTQPGGRRTVDTGFDNDPHRRQTVLRTIQQAREVGAINKEAGIGKTVSGLAKTAGGIVSLFPGLGTAAAAGLSLASTLIGKLSGWNKSVQSGAMQGRIVDRELQMNERIQALEQELLAQDIDPGRIDRGTKERIVLQRMGYNSGSKREVFMNIVMNRSAAMTDMANDRKFKAGGDAGLFRKVNADARKLHGEDKYLWGDEGGGITDDERAAIESKREEYRRRKFARRVLKDMGLRKVGSKDVRGYAQQGVAERLGMAEGIDIHHQLAESRKGESAADTADSRLAKIDAEIAALTAKLQNTRFGFMRRGIQAQIAGLQSERTSLNNTYHG